MFGKGFSNHTMSAVVSRSNTNRLTNRFLLKHVYSFVATVTIGFVLYVFIHGLFGQRVKLILSQLFGKTDSSKLSQKSGFIYWCIAGGGCSWIP